MRSMTGFASVDGALPSEGGDGGVGPPGEAGEVGAWRWDLRSVNGRGLELRIRAPGGWEAVEARWRAHAAEQFRRGTVHASLSLSRPTAARAAAVNAAALAEAAAATAAASAALRAAGLAPGAVDPAALLGVRGVMEMESPVSEGPSEADIAAVSAGFEAAAEALLAARAAEGRALSAALTGRLDEIEALTARAAERIGPRQEIAQRRLRERVAEVLGAGAPVEEARIAQELALLVVKADVQEEIDRLGAHIAAGRALLAEAAPVGRKLEFLTQEFNREANTLCAKAQDAELTEIGLELKVVIDQLREQAANVE